MIVCCVHGGVSKDICISVCLLHVFRSKSRHNHLYIDGVHAFYSVQCGLLQCVQFGVFVCCVQFDVCCEVWAT